MPVPDAGEVRFLCRVPCRHRLVERHVDAADAALVSHGMTVAETNLEPVEVHIVKVAFTNEPADPLVSLSGTHGEIQVMLIGRVSLVRP